MVVNIIGCFCIGLAMEATEGRFAATPAVRLFITVGLLGGFTTFSTFSLETLNLVRDGFVIKAAINAVGSLLLGLMAAYAGLVAGRVL
jgi:CrcB protein